MNESIWNIAGSLGRLSSKRVQASVTLDRASSGLAGIAVDGEVLSDACLLGVRVPHRDEDAPPIEAYVRGTDIVAKYPPRPTDLVSHQLMYRVGATDEHPLCSLVLSAQTSRLDSDPMTQVVSCFGQGEIVVGGESQSEVVHGTRHFHALGERPTFFLIRPVAIPNQSVLLFVHPTDFHAAWAKNESGQIEIGFEVFPNSLEKGVIRRAVFGCSFLPRTEDLAVSNRIAHVAKTAPPPLAT